MYTNKNILFNPPIQLEENSDIIQSDDDNLPEGINEKVSTNKNMLFNSPIHSKENSDIIQPSDSGDLPQGDN